MKQIPFFLVTGFLGSGKTTFLRNILEKYASEQRLAVVQNEFAPANIDGEALKQTGKKFELLEITNGSVFCVCLLHDFTNSLKHFVDQHQPDAVFLEASGLSDPISIAELFMSDELRQRLFLNGVWSIIDAPAFLTKVDYLTRLQHQVRVADVIYINKVDLISEQQLTLVEEKARAINPFARIFRTSYCRTDLAELNFNLPAQTVADRIGHTDETVERCKRPEVGVGVLRSSREIRERELHQFINYFAQKTIRIKGFAKLPDGAGMAVQSSYLRTSFEKVDKYAGSTELIAIGKEFNLSEFSKMYRTLVT